MGCFDVRFVTDSIFERAARTIHLGVMVGFAIVATYFDPEEQTKGTFQALCKSSREILELPACSAAELVAELDSTGGDD